MRPVYFLRPKGYATIAFGLLLIIAPLWLMSLMGAEVGAAGETMIRLLGLPLLLIGYSMATTPKEVSLNPAENLLTVLIEVAAIAVVTYATQAGTFNLLGYALASVYVVSGVGFLYCFVAAIKQRKEAAS